MAFINESHIEQADIQFFEENLQYDHIDAWEKKLVGRDSLKDVVLKDRLIAALQKLNPLLPVSCISQTVEELTRSRAALTPIMANKELHLLLIKGFPVTYPNSEDKEEKHPDHLGDEHIAGGEGFCGQAVEIRE